MFKSSSIKQDLLQNPAVPIGARQEALDRAFADPGIPDQFKTTQSFWLKDADPGLANVQSKVLPTIADVVVIGTGVSGASVTKALLEANPGKGVDNVSAGPSIVVLDARPLCSGATGRNGGHMMETAEYFRDLVTSVGLDAAKKVMRLRLSHVHDLLQVSRDFGLLNEAQTRSVQFLSAYFEEPAWREVVDNIDFFKASMPTEAAAFRIIQKHEIPKDFKLPHAIGIVAGPAGAIWPYKFVSGVFARLRSQYGHRLAIETNTPVIELVRGCKIGNGPVDHPYQVITARGTIFARHVVHCTNAHAAHLLPGLRGRIFPLRGQMSAQTPGDAFSPQGSRHSWLFNYKRGSYDYLTQLPWSTYSDQEMMFGGGFSQAEKHGIADFGIARDDKLSLYADIHLSGALSAVFGHENWGTVSRGQQVKNMWTGNMGFSADGFPWVGRVPRSVTIDLDSGAAAPSSSFHSDRGQASDTKDNSAMEGGEWLSVAFSGEGMVHAWRCGIALATMIRRSDRSSFAREDSCPMSWFPDQFLVTEERIRNSVLPRTVTDGCSSENIGSVEALEDWIHV